MSTYKVVQMVNTKPSPELLVAFYSVEPSTTKDSKGVQMLPISEARKFRFTTPPVADTVYVADRRDRRLLIRFADYNFHVAEAHLNEGLRIVQTLGALEVAAYCHRGESGDKASGWGITGLVSFEKRSVSSQEWDVYFESVGRGSAPRDPRPLTYPDFPGFEAACDAVLVNGATDVQITISTSETFNVGGEIGGILRGAGFWLGSKADTARQSLFLIQARFPEGAAVKNLETSPKASGTRSLGRKSGA